MRHISIVVRADWDDEAKVWTASSNDISGLAVEAATLEMLEPKILSAIADLLVENCNAEAYKGISEVPVHILAEQKTFVSLDCV